MSDAMVGYSIQENARTGWDRIAKRPWRVVKHNEDGFATTVSRHATREAAEKRLRKIIRSGKAFEIRSIGGRP